jgi:hypothetical protein
MPSNPESPPLPPKLQAWGQMRRNKGSRCVAQHCIVAIITAAVSLRRRHPPVSTQVTDHGIRLSFRFTSKASRAVGAGVVAWVVALQLPLSRSTRSGERPASSAWRLSMARSPAW